MIMCGRAPCGKKDCTWSEEYRAAAEIRTVAKMEAPAQRKYFEAVAHSRGKEAAAAISAGVDSMHAAEHSRIFRNARPSSSTKRSPSPLF